MNFSKIRFISDLLISMVSYPDTVKVVWPLSISWFDLLDMTNIRVVREEISKFHVDTSRRFLKLCYSTYQLSIQLKVISVIGKQDVKVHIQTSYIGLL